ncbi:MAG: cellobiohydrolase [Streptomyces sp.]|nr:cellobiohydrolase [Streptomyces sp.]
MTPHTSPTGAPGVTRRRKAAISVAATTVLAGALLGAQLATSGVAVAGSLPTNTAFWTNPNASPAKWVAANPGDSRTPLISSRIASQPSATWFANYSPSTVTNDVRSITSAAASAGQVPVLVAYMIPNRDCGGASAGGAPDLTSYQAWVKNFAAGLGSGRTIVILEPDSISLTTCLSAQQQSDRFSALSQAGAAIHAADPQAKVYMDGGHSAWNSAADQASRLRSAGVLTNSDGVFSNVSNFRYTSDEVSYIKSILSSLGNPSNLHGVVDTSRNGKGPDGSVWCDPTGRGLGTYPTANTGDSAIDAYLWIKIPGEADGCAAAAGTFVADIAYGLASNAASAPPTTQPPTTQPPTTQPPTTQPPTTQPPTTQPPTTQPPTSNPSSSCAVTYHVSSSWAGGFTTDVTIKNTGSSALSSWTLKWTFPNDQKVTNAWNAAATQSGTAVTATNLSYNGSIPAGGTASFGFQGTVGGTNSSPTAFTLNGAACSLA